MDDSAESKDDADKEILGKEATFIGTFQNKNSKVMDFERHGHDMGVPKINMMRILYACFGFTSH